MNIQALYACEIVNTQRILV